MRDGNTHEERPPPLQSVELGQFLDLEIKQAAVILERLMREGTLMMIHGPAGVGKTYLMLSLAIAAAYAVDILGWHPPAPIIVVYIDGEMTAPELQLRCKALMEPILPAINHEWQPLHIVTPDLQIHGIKPIDTDEGKVALIDLVKGHGARLVVLDNLSCLTNPEDDNAAGSWQAVQELLLALRRVGIAVIVGHHSGKGGQQRGTSRRADILDVILKLSAVTSGEDDGRTRVNIEFEKARALKAEEKLPFVATLEPHPAGGLTWSRADSSAPVIDRVRQMLLDGMSPGEVAQEIRANRSYVYRIKNEMVSAGELGNPSTRPRHAVSCPPTKRGGLGDTSRVSPKKKRGDKQETQETTPP